MSWENQDCVCGGQKPRETMLCEACQEYVAGSDDAETLADEQCSTGERRAAAIRLLARARNRPGRIGKR